MWHLLFFLSRPIWVIVAANMDPHTYMQLMETVEIREGLIEIEVDVNSATLCGDYLTYVHKCTTINFQTEQPPPPSPPRSHSAASLQCPTGCRYPNQTKLCAAASLHVQHREVYCDLHKGPFCCNPIALL